MAATLPPFFVESAEGRALLSVPIGRLFTTIEQAHASVTEMTETVHQACAVFDALVQLVPHLTEDEALPLLPEMLSFLEMVADYQIDLVKQHRKCVGIVTVMRMKRSMIRCATRLQFFSFSLRAGSRAFSSKAAPQHHTTTNTARTPYQKQPALHLSTQSKRPCVLAFDLCD